EEYYHCHEPTLRRLTVNPTFERLVVAPPCTVMSRLDSPVNERPSDLNFVPKAQLTVMYPKYTRSPGRQYPSPTDILLEDFCVEAIDSSDREPSYVLDRFVRWRRERDPSWPAATGPFVGAGELPSLGYVISHLETKLTFYHPGDLQEAFD